MTVMAFVVTVVATHWPRLQLGDEAPSDKLIHALTFGILTILLWRARAIRQLWIVLIAMLVFSVVDETTQSLAIFARHTSLADWLADVTGLSVACLLIAMTARPINPVTRMRAALADAAERDMLDRPFTWIAVATTAALGALVGIPTTIALAHSFLRDRHPWQTGFLGALFFAAVGIEIARSAGRRAAVRRITSERSCFRCGARQAGAGAPGESTSGSCNSCAAPWVLAQWVPPRESVRRSNWLSTVNRRMFVGLLFATMAAALIALAAERSQYLVPADMLDMWSYAAVILTLGVILRTSAVAHIRECAREGSSCLACNYNLVATQAIGGVGRCPECAVAFARIDPTETQLDGGAKPSGALED